MVCDACRPLCRLILICHSMCQAEHIWTICRLNDLVLSRSFQIFPDLSRSFQMVERFIFPYLPTGAYPELWSGQQHCTATASRLSLNWRQGKLLSTCPCPTEAHMRSITGSVAGVGRMMLWGLGWRTMICWTCLYIAYWMHFSSSEANKIKQHQPCFLGMFQFLWIHCIRSGLCHNLLNTPC